MRRRKSPILRYVMLLGGAVALLKFSDTIKPSLSNIPFIGKLINNE